MMRMEGSELESSTNGNISPSQESISNDTTDNAIEIKPATQDGSSDVKPVPSLTAVPQRNLPGTKDEKLYQWPQRPLEAIESAFALREFLQALIRQDPHDVDRLIALPPGQDENAWVYEHLCQICLELNFLIVHLEAECTPEVCPEMRAEEWMYYCATHRTPREIMSRSRDE
ncbi:MOB member 4, phocein [Haplosporangium sp. Z 767]|nr:MOB member 4, phocein [Haplosporangium sp. Z 767]KAF9180519.1 MOB member 4, phocein [Haplosporangium sp. Z 11]